MKKLALKLFLFALLALPAHADFYNGVYADTNNVILPGFKLLTAALQGTINTTNLPASYIDTNVLTTATNNLSTNTAAQLNAASNTLAASLLDATNRVFTNLNSKINIASNFLSTNTLAQLNSSSNFLSTNFLGLLTFDTNNLSTNFTAQLNYWIYTITNLDIYNLTFASNTLQLAISQVQTNLNVTSNALFQFSILISNNIVVTSNRLITISNSLAGNITTTSNALLAAIVATSNLVTSTKAFSLTLPATYTTIGAAFSAPLMPDGNYSVAVTPQDVGTAGVFSGNGMEFFYADTKTGNGFNLRILFATNFDLHFDIFVKENTQ